MNKEIWMVFALLILSSCGALHDGSGWEHNMDDDLDTVLEHKH